MKESHEEDRREEGYEEDKSEKDTVRNIISVVTACASCYYRYD